MGWSIGFDSNWSRHIGYGVPAQCDHPDCTETIDRGLSYVCGGQPYGGEHGCGLYFCSKHMHHAPVLDEGEEETDDTEYRWCCERCRDLEPPFDPKPDAKIWINHKLTHESWAPWRAENPEWVKAHSNTGNDHD